MKIEKNCRIIAVTVTPFDEKGNADIEEILAQTEQLCNSQADAILPCASTGEFVKMDLPERAEILRAVAKQNNGRKKLIAGACDTSAKRVLDSIKVAKECGYDAAIVCPPYYYGLSQEDVLAFYREVCEGAPDMPIIAYHVPFFTTGIEIPTYRKMLLIPNLVGIKDSSANMKRISHLCNIAKLERPDFAVFTGTDDCLFPALCAGCHGSMTALGASMPAEIRAIYDAFDAGDIAVAMQRQQAILPIIREADAFAFPIGYKLLAKACGSGTDERFADNENAAADKMAAMLKELRK
ncbi:MAG: dihydrodipicolinate synthase family protein [Clostridia bacterium]|nr:dihydrodipicolinate synthase family protein [Clostridia bacterium]